MRRVLSHLPDAASVGVDWTHPLSRGLVFATHATSAASYNGDPEIVSGIQSIDSGLTHQWASVEGPARYRSDQTSNYIYKWFSRHNIGVGDMTCAVRFMSTGGSWGICISNSTDSLGWSLYQNRNESAESANAGQFLTYDATNGIYAVACENYYVVDTKFRWYIGVRRQGALELWRDGVLMASKAAGTVRNVNGGGTNRIAMGYGVYNSKGRWRSGYVWNRALLPGDIATLAERPDTLGQSSVRYWRGYSVAGTTGGGVVTESASGRLQARGSDTGAPIRTEAVTARRKARGEAAVVAIKTEAVSGRRKAHASDTTTAIRAESAVGRIKARGTTTVTHIDAGAVVEAVAGRRQVRASVTSSPIRTEAVIARRQARGSDTITLTRTIAASGRRKARGAVTSAPVVAGMITEAVAGRLRARSSSTATTTRIEAIATRRHVRSTAVINGIRAALAAGRARLRAAVTGAPYVPPTSISIDPRYLAKARGRRFTART